MDKNEQYEKWLKQNGLAVGDRVKVWHQDAEILTFDDGMNLAFPGGTKHRFHYDEYVWIRFDQTGNTNGYSIQEVEKQKQTEKGETTMKKTDTKAQYEAWLKKFNFNIGDKVKFGSNMRPGVILSYEDCCKIYPNAKQCKPCVYIWLRYDDKPAHREWWGIGYAPAAVHLVEKVKPKAKKPPEPIRGKNCKTCGAPFEQKYGVWFCTGDKLAAERAVAAK